jgi:hypothetical protein
MTIIEQARQKLIAVPCDPEGTVCITGSNGDLREIAEALAMLAAHDAQPAAEPTPDSSRESVMRALRKAYNLGQVYWQQADSEFTSHHRKADETAAKLEHLIADTVAALDVAQQQEPAAWRYWKDKFACYEYSDTRLSFPAVPAGTMMFPLYPHPSQDAKDAARLRDALKSIWQFGADTLSGRVDSPDDREWQRDAVKEMTKRAGAAMEAKK